MNKNVLVTGATGFIGYHLCERLYEEGYRVFAFGRKDENKIKCNEFYTSDLRNIPWRDISKIDICFHLAADDGRFGKDDSEIIDVNLRASSNLFRGLSELGCKKFVYSSSYAVYGDQSSPFQEDSTPLEGKSCFAKSKIDFEKFVKSFSSRTKSVCVGLRYTEVYGTYEFYKRSYASFVNRVIKKLHKNERPLINKDGTQKRDFVYITDVIDANILASRYNESDVFNIGSGTATSFNEIFYSIAKKMNKNLAPIYTNNSDVFGDTAFVGLEKSKTKLKYTPKYRIEDGIQDLKIKLRKLFS